MNMPKGKKSKGRAKVNLTRRNLRIAIVTLLVGGVILAVGGFLLDTQNVASSQEGVDTAPDSAPPARVITPSSDPQDNSDITGVNKNPPPPTNQSNALVSGNLDQTTNILLLGSDKRPGDGVWRTDTIMIVFLDTARGRAAVLSLPRDLYVNIPDRGWDRINIADFWGEYKKYPGGGPGLLARVIQDNFSIRIDHFARVNFDGFKQIIDTVGGVDVSVPCALEDDFVDPTVPGGFRHFQVNAGITHMDGDLALMFSRQRHGNSDIDRANRQQRVLVGLRSKLLTPEALPKIPDLYRQFYAAVQTDLSIFDVVNLARSGATIDPKNIHGKVVDETMSYLWMTPDGKSVLVFDKNKIGAAVNALFDAPQIDDSKVLCE